MDRLYDIFKDILNASEKRKLKLLRYLVDTNEVITYQKICGITGSSLKTVKGDIDYLNDTLQEYGCIEKDGTDKLTVQVYHDDFKELVFAFYRTRKCIQIINLLLEKEYTSIKLSQELHIAPSSCYMYLQQIRAFLKKYHLKLERQTLTITGEEVNIRKLMFLSQLMKNKKSDSDSFVDAFLREVEFFGIKFSPALKGELQIVIDVMMKRVGSKNNINISNKIKKKIYEESIYSGLYQSIFGFFLEKGLLLLEDELAYMIIYLMNNGTLLIEENKEASIKNVKEKDPTTYYALKELIESFGKSLSISSENQDLFLYLLNFIRSRYISMGLFPYHYFFENVKKEKNELSLTLHFTQEEINKIKEIFYHWAGKHRLKHIDPNDIETCLIVIEACQLQEKRPNKYNIFLHISKGQEWEFYLQSVLNQAFGDSVHVFSYHSMGMNLNDVQEMGIDFVVSDTNLHLPIDAEVIILEEPYNLSAIEKLKIII